MVVLRETDTHKAFGFSRRAGQQGAQRRECTQKRDEGMRCSGYGCVLVSTSEKKFLLPRWWWWW